MTLLLGLSAASASADVLIEAYEEGNDVVFRTSGALRLEGLGPGDHELLYWNAGTIVPVLPALYVGHGYLDKYHDVFTTPPEPFGWRQVMGRTANLHGGTGIGFAIAYPATDVGDLWVDRAYKSGNEIDGFLRFFSADFHELGLLPGTQSYELVNGETVTLSLVPIPGAMWLILGGLAAMAGLSGSARHASRPGPLLRHK